MGSWRRSGFYPAYPTESRACASPFSTTSHMLAEWICCNGSLARSLSESWVLTTTDWALLFVLGVVCTVGGHVLLINGLRNVRAQTASMLIAGLEPVCAIVLALFLLGEVPSLQTLVGGILIVSTTVYMITRSE